MKTERNNSLMRRVEGITGRNYGFGNYTYDKPKDVAPDGWRAFGPYTGCFYCPECWKKIAGE